MKVLIVSAVFPPEPVVSAQISFDVAENLTEKGCEVIVLTPCPSRPSGFVFDHRKKDDFIFKRIMLPSYTSPKSSVFKRLIESYSFGKHTARFIRRNSEGINVVYANTWPLFSQFLLVRELSKHRIPLVLHIQDIYPESLAEKQSPVINKLLMLTFKPLDKYILKHASKVISISNLMRDHLITSRVLEPTRIMTVRNWQKNDNSVKTVRGNHAAFTFMFLGTLNQSANLPSVIKAFAGSDISNSRLVIAGDGPEKEKCVRLASMYPSADIKFIDAGPDKVNEIQSGADVMILSLLKGVSKTATPSKLSAYMFSSRPVLACVDEGSDVEKIITSSDCGWITPPEDDEALSKSMISISALPQEILRIKGDNGLKYATDQLSRDSNLKKLTEIILNSAT